MVSSDLQTGGSQDALHEKLAAPQVKLQTAISLHQEGKIEAAVKIYREVLAVSPRNFDCLHLMGVAKYQTGEFEEAEKLISAAILEKGDFPAAYSNRGVARKEQGKFVQALRDFDKALELDRGYIDARFNRGNTFLELKKYEEALAEFDGVLSLNENYADAHNGAGVALSAKGDQIAGLRRFARAIELNPSNEKYFNSRGACWLRLGKNSNAVADFDQAIRLKPNFVDALANKGNTLRELGQLADAKACLELAVAIQPQSAVCLLSLGLVYAGFGDHEAALHYFNKALSIKSEYPAAHFSKGNALVALDRVNEGIEAYGKAVELKSDYAEAFNNRGVAFSRMLRTDRAETDYLQAIAINADYAEAYVNRGNILKRLGEFDEAIECYNRALAIKPDFSEAYFNRGLTFADVKKYTEALLDYDRAFGINPNYEYLLGLRLHTEMKLCKWDQFDSSLEEIKSGIECGRKVIVPFFLLGLSDDPKLHLKAAQQFAPKRISGNIARLDGSNCSERRIRIGYYSADFYNHATSYLIAELLELHDRNRFELFGFSFGPSKDDAMRHRVTAAFDRFFDVSQNTDLEISQISRNIGIDIAVDLGGHTLNARTGAFACRCAPTQLSYLGYPGTMGAEYIDYIVADRTVIPPENQRYFTEKVLYMPDCYQVNDRKRQQRFRNFDKREYGLPESGIIFCCFNNSWKILPSVFKSWMRILGRVDGSVLWLLEDTPQSSMNLRSTARSHGIDPRRLIFAQRVTTEEHLSRHRLADIFLDTLPYNAHTTASDAIWSGVPIVTRIGQSFAGRVAASLLKHVGLSDLIVHTMEDYQEKAVSLALDPKVLGKYKESLKENRLTSSLFDTIGFARHLEDLYIDLAR